MNKDVFITQIEDPFNIFSINKNEIEVKFLLFNRMRKKEEKKLY